MFSHGIGPQVRLGSFDGMDIIRPDLFDTMHRTTPRTEAEVIESRDRKVVVFGHCKHLNCLSEVLSHYANQLRRSPTVTIL